MNLKQLRQQHADLAAESDRIITAIEKESRRFSDVERDRLGTIDKEMETLGTDIVLQEQVLDRRRSAPSIPDANAIIDVENERIAQIKTADPRPFRTFADQMVAVIRVGRGGAHAMDPRLAVVAAASGMGESVPSDGGFLLQRQYDTEILKHTYDDGQILSRVNRKAIGAAFNGIRVNAIDESSRADGSRWGGVLGYWTNEADTLAGSKPKFRQIDMTLQKLTGLVYLTDELIMDTTAMEGVIMEALPAELNFRAEDAVWEGTGAGQPQGIMNCAAKVAVAKETGQDATTIVFQNIVNMWSRLWARSMQNAVWFINQDALPQLFGMNMAIGTGGVPVYMPAGGISGSPYSSLMGRPVIPVEYASTLGTEGDIALVDLSQYLMIDKSTVESASSIHVRFLNDETVLRFVYRTNGQPIWNKPLIPFKGAATKSPFITLATRS
jgi:HK97 family phage major capsid protein